MGTKLELPKITELRPQITVVGVGGAGCNAVNNMIDSGLDGVTFVAANTDSQALAASNAEMKIQLGARLTEGLGAGSKPEIGEAAAHEAIEDIRNIVSGSHMVFVAAGMGGGTGTGAASVIARAARDLGILTVAVVTKPFQFEGARRMRIAEAGIEELRKSVDTLIVIPNQNLFRIASDKTTFAEAFVLADQVLYSGVACIVDLIIKEGLINLDFADVRTVMSGMGSAMMGTGEASGDRRAILAAEDAIANPLLDDVTLKGAKGLLLSITGGSDLTLFEVDEAASRVREEVDPEANIIVGATCDPTMGDRVRVSIVASGMASAAGIAGRPSSRGAAESRSGIVEPKPRDMASAFPMPLSAGAHSLAASSEHDAPANSGRFRGDAEPGTELGTDSLQQRLSTALGYGDTGEATAGGGHSNGYAEVSPPPLPGHRSSTWHGPDGVEIEELRPAPLAEQVPSGPHQASRGPLDAFPGAFTGHPQGGFRPEAPAELRRPPRRMPEVQDFPPHSQREYYAKSAEAHREEADRRAEPRVAEQRAPRRPSFFERLTGRGRSSGDSRQTAPSSAERRDPEPPLGYSTEIHQRSRPAIDPGSDDRSMAREKPELPVFFNRTRR